MTHYKPHDKTTLWQLRQWRGATLKDYPHEQISTALALSSEGFADEFQITFARIPVKWMGVVYWFFKTEEDRAAFKNWERKQSKKLLARAVKPDTSPEKHGGNCGLEIVLDRLGIG